MKFQLKTSSSSLGKTSKKEQLIPVQINFLNFYDFSSNDFLTSKDIEEIKTKKFNLIEKNKKKLSYNNNNNDSNEESLFTSTNSPPPSPPSSSAPPSPSSSSSTLALSKNSLRTSSVKLISTNKKINANDYNKTNYSRNSIYSKPEISTLANNNHFKHNGIQLNSNQIDLSSLYVKAQKLVLPERPITTKSIINIKKSYSVLNNHSVYSATSFKSQSDESCDKEEKKFKNNLKSNTINMEQHYQNNTNTNNNNNNNNDEELSLSLGPMNKELEMYVKQKKEINEKIHTHWKLELNNNDSYQKGKTLKINDDMFKSDKQWLTIANPAPNLAKEDSFFNENTKSENPLSLIDTFTASMENTDKKLDSYKVNSEVGTLIAQKLMKGDKIRVGRNGQYTSSTSNNENSLNTFSLGQNSLARIFEGIAIPGNSVLSWTDQIKQSDIKIIEPKIQVTNTLKKQKPERSLIVKKLTEEDEYKPKINKPTIKANSFNLSNYSRSNHSSSTNRPAQDRSNGSAKKIHRSQVEVVGVNTNASSLPPHNNHQRFELAPSSSSNVSNNNNNKLNQQDFVIESTQIGPPSSRQTIRSSLLTIDNLSEKNYLEIIDNLTSRYLATSTTADANKTSNSNEQINQSKKVKNENSKETKVLISLEILNDLGLNNSYTGNNTPATTTTTTVATTGSTTATVVAELSNNFSSVAQKENKEKLKLLEKKYKKILNENKNNSNVINKRENQITPTQLLNNNNNNLLNINCSNNATITTIQTILTNTNNSSSLNSPQTTINNNLNSSSSKNQDLFSPRISQQSHYQTKKVESITLNNVNDNNSKLGNHSGLASSNENAQTKLQSLGGGYYYNIITTNNNRNVASQRKAAISPVLFSSKSLNNKQFNLKSLKLNANDLNPKYLNMVQPLSPRSRHSNQATSNNSNNSQININKKSMDLYEMKRQEINVPLMIPSTPNASMARFN